MKGQMIYTRAMARRTLKPAPVNSLRTEGAGNLNSLVFYRRGRDEIAQVAE